jgi:hypothetical protein
VLGLAAAGHYVVTATTSCNDPVARPRA